jgi:hypothetical protein
MLCYARRRSPCFVRGGGGFVSGVLAARASGDWIGRIAHRGVLAAEADVEKRRRKEAMDGGGSALF